MTLRFVKTPTKRWSELDPFDKVHVALLWEALGSADELSHVDELLNDSEVKRYEVRDANDALVAVWWQSFDGGLMFRGTTQQIVGVAIQHGFVCNDRSLWDALATADGRPGSISWDVDAQGARDVGTPERDAQTIVAELDAMGSS